MTYRGRAEPFAPPPLPAELMTFTRPGQVTAGQGPGRDTNGEALSTKRPVSVQEDALGRPRLIAVFPGQGARGR